MVFGSRRPETANGSRLQSADALRTHRGVQPADLSDFFDEMAGALQDYDTKRLEIIGFRGWPNGSIEIYIQPNPIIRRMTFNDTMEALDNFRKSSVMSSEFFVEAVAYQQAAIEEMERPAFSVEAMYPMKDKRARLRVAARYIKTGVVKFPVTDASSYSRNFWGLVAEKHDDAVDALVYLFLPC